MGDTDTYMVTDDTGSEPSDDGPPMVSINTATADLELADASVGGYSSQSAHSSQQTFVSNLTVGSPVEINAQSTTASYVEEYLRNEALNALNIILKACGVKTLTKTMCYKSKELRAANQRILLAVGKKL